MKIACLSPSLALLFGFLFPLQAQDFSAPKPSAPDSGVSKPLILTSREKILSSFNFHTPPPPTKASDGSLLQVTEDQDPPTQSVMDDLTSLSIFPQIQKLNRAETGKGKYYWHSSTVWNYCHTLDSSRRHWYGWKTGSTFHWVLFYGKSFWWRDSHIGRWLYYYKGCWWWPDPQDPKKVQVRLNNGRYYLCGLDGTLGADIGGGENPGAVNSTISIPAKSPTPSRTQVPIAKHHRHKKNKAPLNE